jgi:catechol 2,3-dioxygenase-like lactoylglutathione lyase family enzyme
MKYSGPLLAVKDIEKSKDFYRDVLGLKIVLDFGANVTFEPGFSIQQDFTALVGLDPASEIHPSRNFELYFEVEDLDSWHEKFTATPGLQFVHGIKEYPWGQRVFRIYDPDLHIIEFGESMEMVVKRFLAQGLSVEETAQRSMFPIEFVRSCQ